MQYKEFLDHIYQKYSGNVKLELDRMEHILEELGHPEATLHGFHVGGTNGKGSVCASLEALSLALGHRTGLNTSPHLIDYTERFRVAGSDLPFDMILETFLKHEALFEKWDASFFEITTAIAFSIFAEQKIQTSVIEVGLGGRLDATNLWTPDISVITTIGLDHIKTLGPTLEIIAGEKAGIIKPGVPLVLGRIEASPRMVILNKAIEQHVQVYICDEDFFVENVSVRLDGLEFDYRFQDVQLEGLHVNLLGEHQAVNVATALTAFILYLRKLQLTPSEELIREAVQHINWRGRMQLVHRDPTIIVDGAHNVQGITALMNSLRRIYPAVRPIFILSILADKNYSEMIRLVCENASRIYVAQNKSDRAATVEEQSREIALHNTPYIPCASVRDAYDQVLREANASDVIICGGSLYTVGEILSHTNN